MATTTTTTTTSAHQHHLPLTNILYNCYIYIYIYICLFNVRGLESKVSAWRSPSSATWDAGMYLDMTGIRTITLSAIVVPVNVPQPMHKALPAGFLPVRKEVMKVFVLAPEDTTLLQRELHCCLLLVVPYTLVRSR